MGYASNTIPTATITAQTPYYGETLSGNVILYLAADEEESSQAPSSSSSEPSESKESSSSQQHGMIDALINRTGHVEHNQVSINSCF